MKKIGKHSISEHCWNSAVCAVYWEHCWSLVICFTSKEVHCGGSTCGVLCLLYFQNLPELRRSASLCSRTVLSLCCSKDSSLFTPNRELVSMRKYFASLSSLVTLLNNWWKQRQFVHHIKPMIEVQRNGIAIFVLLWIAQRVRRLL